MALVSEMGFSLGQPLLGKVGPFSEPLCERSEEHNESFNVASGNEVAIAPKATGWRRYAVVVAVASLLIIIVLLKIKSSSAPTHSHESISQNGIVDEHYLGSKFAIDDSYCRGDNHLRSPGDGECDPGPPYLYVTFHGGRGSNRIRNVCKYSRTGCPLGAVLKPSSSYVPRSLRGMLLIGEHLIVAEAHYDSSKLVEYGGCDDAGRRNMTRVLTTYTNENSGLVHPYGLSAAIIHDKTYLLVSVQDRAEILRYDMFSMEPIASPATLKLPAYHDSVLKEAENVTLERPVPRLKSEKDRKADAGAFILFPLSSRLRDVVYAYNGTLFVANEDEGVLEYNWDGAKVATIPIASPISVYFSAVRNTLWVSLRNSHSVIEIDVVTKQQIQTIQHKYLRHPTGIAGDFEGETLYVLSQTMGTILQFSMSSGKFVRTIAKNLYDDAERLLMSPC